jgi:hypothetical protein
MSKQTTPMQELIEWMGENSGIVDTRVHAKATELLEKEKNIIVDAYRTGKSHEANGTLTEINMDGAEFFNQTYIQ